MTNDEGIEVYRRHAEGAANRVSGTSQERSIVSYFDWEIPALTTPHLLTFLARVRCGARERSLRVPIDIAKLEAGGRTADLERLHGILALRHAGIDTPHSLLAGIEWMLDVSFQQQQPRWNAKQRNQKVRELLLAPP
jgi:hypothetical protein